MPVSKARANKFYIYIMYLYCLFICIKTDYRDNTSDYAVHIFYYIKVIRQFGCFSANLLTRETTR